MVVFDTATLLLLLDPNASPPKEPETGERIDRCKERLDHLVSQFEEHREKVIIPTPTLSEVLVRAGDAGPAYLETLNTSACFKIVPFDIRASVELAVMTRQALDQGDKKEGHGGPSAKIKFDRQIIAISRVEGAETIYSDDSDMRKLASKYGLQIICTHEIPLPPEDPQARLFDDNDSVDESKTQ
jgi:predicted nucleic acid-binding protein